MRVDVIASVGEAIVDDLLHKTVVAIDVLRATTVMTTALEQGAEGIVPVETVAQARSLQQAGDLLGGERGCKKIPGFDYGNSPYEFLDGSIAGRRLIMTTTNGTRAIQKAQKAGCVLAGSFRNAAACAKAAAALDKDIVLLCAGTQDVFSLEDGLCAGALLHEIRSVAKGVLAPNDFGLAMEAAFLQHRANLTDTILNCSNGIRLTKLGYSQDVGFCTEISVSSTVPKLHGHILKPIQ
ncbi:2-phosphosulfolactate phosphatase [Paenibacillus turpanensis]|uniref:2-phosphosulfolactate phosphatase n=1 Tax=Paenibacillus turpanensis TaxID=2689078 RepID=UPI00140B2381|nr:2-phosphosulfolactate phosphatase [Paenibacillus turpanensis]